MTAGLALKHTLKRTAGTLAIVAARTGIRVAGPAGCILAYHRVADVGWGSGALDNWNVAPTRFSCQIGALAASADCVPLAALPARLAAWTPGSRPLVCLTFDDGFANAFEHVLPTLERYAVPATFFVVTSYIGCRDPMPFDRWGCAYRDRVPPVAWRAMDWSELDACVASGLVTVGSHSHAHLDGRHASAAQLREEAERSRDVLRSRLGIEHARSYAYPYGSARLGHVPPHYTEAVRKAGYDYAVSTELGVAQPDSDPFLLPRVEAHGLDSPAVLRAKVAGALLPYYVTDRLRRAGRRPA